MEINRRRSRLLFNILNSMDSKLGVFFAALNLTVRKSGSSSIRERAHKRPKWEYKLNNKTVTNIGFLSHNIMRNMELNLLRSQLKYMKRPILDLGCGNGQFATLLFERVEAGVDLSSDILIAANQTGIYDVLKQCDCTKNIPLENNKFKTIFSNSVVEHIPDIEGLVSQVSQKLHKEGIFILTTYTDEFTTSLSEGIGNKKTELYNKSMSHVSLYSIDKWESIFKKNNMEVKKIIKYLNPEALFSMYFFSSNIFKIFEATMGYLFWIISRKKLYDLVHSSLDKDEGLGIMIVAGKT